MAVRIAGVVLPTNKRIEIALTYIYGIGRTLSKKILEVTKVDPNTRTDDLKDSDVEKLRDEVGKYVIEGNLRRRVSSDIKRLQDIGSYRGYRHRRKLPVRGQRTRTNARTRKGKAVAVAGKKQVGK